ncbi:MAG: hypothetical protein ABIT05_13935 [Chitinophagaceae bacterium]
MSGKNKPLSKEEISKSADPRIDEDFKGYPHGPATDKTIKPGTSKEHDVAGTEEKDGEKRIIRPDERKGLDEQESDGSAGAFDDK